jgi:phosphohistidine phosphatase
MMNLYLLRHAPAVPRAANFSKDPLRPLTQEGIKKISRVAKGMHLLDLKFDLILFSPLLRARQTADRVAAEFHAKSLQNPSIHLNPDRPPQALIAELKKNYPSHTNILIVGHEPQLSQLISVLLIGSEILPLTLKKGGLCKLSIENLRDNPCARLEWLLTSRQLRQLAGKSHRSATDRPPRQVKGSPPSRAGSNRN